MPDNFKLVFNAEGAKFYQESDPMIYVDFKKSAIGKIYSDLKAKTVHFINTMKPIPQNMLEAFSREIAISLPEITPPKEVKIINTEIKDIKPTPCLFLSCDLNSKGDVLFYKMKLQFEYEKYLIPFYPEIPCINLI